MKVIKVGMEGFKNHKNLVEYNLSSKTIVSGDNGEGKTTIGEAITWCLLGTDLTGNERATTRLTNNDSKTIYAEIDFELEGKEHNLIRRKKGNKTDIYLDGTEIKSNDLVHVYRDKDTFLSIFNPEYFPNLAPKQAKELLNSVLKEVSNEEVFEEMSDFERELLIGNNFKNSNLFLENKREEMKEVEDDVIFSEGFIAAKKEDIEIPPEMQFDESELKTLYEKRVDTEKKMEELKEDEKPKLIEVEPLQKELDFIRSRYVSLKEELINLNNTVECPNCKHKIDLDLDRKNSLVKELKVLEKKGKDIADTIKSKELENEEIIKEHYKLREEKETELSKVAADYEKLLNAIKEIEKEKSTIEANNATRKQLLKLQEENKVKIEEAKKDIENSDKRKSNIKMQMDAAKEFNSIKLRKQAENINVYLDKVTIQLQKVTQQGEIKDDFKILYEGKEFNVLSNSERIKAGLEIGNLIMNNINFKIPIFIDNAESITKYNELDTQIIEARVVEGQELKVEVK